MSNSALSPNFVFLKRHEPQLVRLGTLAERYFKDDPCTCLIKLRQFGELLAQLTAANAGLYRDDRESQLDLLRRLRDDGIATRQFKAQGGFQCINKVFGGQLENILAKLNGSVLAVKFIKKAY